MDMKTIYLDHNASTPVRPDVLAAMMPYFSESFGNASSLYQLGQRSRKAVEEARQAVTDFVGAESPDEILFTSGGTESNNTAIKGTLAASKKGRRVVSSAIEHSSVRNVLKHLSDKGLIDHVVVPVQPNGIVNPGDVDDAMTPDTILVTVMAANNEVGTIQPVEEIAAICRRKGVPFFTDAVQLAGKHPIQAARWGVDMLSISGHKFGAPKGVGALYIRKGTRLDSLIEGGRQEKNRRGGTENIPGIVGLGAAAKIEQRMEHTESARLKEWRDALESYLLKEVPLASLNGDREKRICNTTNICFPYTDSSALIMALDMKGLSCSSGSACAAGSVDPSHVLLAMGLPQDKAHASLRFSLGYSTKEEEVHAAKKIIVEAVARLRETNPLWKDAPNE